MTATGQSTEAWMKGPGAPEFVRRALGERRAARLDDGRWHHVVVVEEEHRPAVVYIDGKRVRTMKRAVKDALVWCGGKVLEGLLWVIGWRRDPDDRGRGPFG